VLAMGNGVEVQPDGLGDTKGTNETPFPVRIPTTPSVINGSPAPSKGRTGTRYGLTGKSYLIGDAKVSPAVGDDMTSAFHRRNLPTFKNRASEMTQTGCLPLIDPRVHSWVSKWDLSMVMALAFTAIVTPVEVAFLDEGRYITALWVINRVVDFWFTIDIFLSLNLAYQASADKGGHWVQNKNKIARHYLKGWFLVDLVSVIPFWAITMDVQDPMGRFAAQRAAAEAAAEALEKAGGGSSGTSQLTRGIVLFRVVKLFRMLKLARVFKAARVFQRVMLDVLMNKFEWTYAALKMLKLFALLCVYAHWQACIWGLVSTYMDADGYPNWISDFKGYYATVHGKVADGSDAMPTGLEIYVAALYWSVMTLTSIGYGEMTPVNTAERVLCSGYMMLSGVMWTYAIGSVAAIATTLDPNTVIFQNTMDQLNYFMRERELTRPMRMTLRDYFTAARRVHQLNDDGDLLDKMSPMLQGTVALAANKKWLYKIWYLRDCGEAQSGSDFIASVAKLLVIRSFVGHERVPVGQLYILRRGLVVKMWRFLNVGKVWGEDFILDNADYVDYSQAVALTYVEVYTLKRISLDEALADHPTAMKVVRKAQRRISLQRAMLTYLCRANGKTGPVSVALRSTAKGFVVCQDEITTEQKVDRILEAVKHGPADKPSAGSSIIAGDGTKQQLDLISSQMAHMAEAINSLSTQMQRMEQKLGQIEKRE
jgi:CRP-like cAMP-binding protein